MSSLIFTPSDTLKPFVKSFVISRRKKAKNFNVLPGTGIVVGFQYSGKLSYQNKNKSISLGPAWITGLNDTYRIFENTNNSSSLTITFSETGAAAFFKCSMHQFFRRCYSLYDILIGSQIDWIITQLKEAKTDILRIKVIESFLLINLKKKDSQELITITVEIIKKHAGDVKIMVLAEQLHVSQSQLEKRFRKVVGASPKKFASIVRLRNVLESAPNYDSMTKLGLQAGYFDQAHFIRDFKSFTGITPERYFKRK